MEYSGTWKEIWTQKGLEKGGKEKVLVFDGWEKSETPIDIIANKIIKSIDLKPEDKVLEVGCGAGGMAQFMNCDYIGIDFSLPLTQKCMEFFRKPAIYSEANDIPFKNGYFDKCFCWGVFLYFPNYEYMKLVVKEMKRVIKKGGGIFIGDIPLRSHSDKHLIYSEDMFREMGFATFKGWAAPYENDRFNAVFK